MYEKRNSTKILVPYPKERLIKIDDGLFNLIYFINSSKAVRTLGCCSGHKKYPITVVVKNIVENSIYEFMSGTPIPRKRRFYKKDKQGYYYIPEVQ